MLILLIKFNPIKKKVIEMNVSNKIWKKQKFSEIKEVIELNINNIVSYKTFYFLYNYCIKTNTNQKTQ
jgi:hypothetical protein